MSAFARYSLAADSPDPLYFYRCPHQRAARGFPFQINALDLRVGAARPIALSRRKRPAPSRLAHLHLHGQQELAGRHDAGRFEHS